MLSNLLGTILIHAEALLGRDHQKLIDEGLHVLANEFACLNIPGHNLSVGFHGLISHERRVPISHLVHKHALVESFNVAKKQSLEFKILGASGSPLQVLELTRLVSVFPMVENEASL